MTPRNGADDLTPTTSVSSPWAVITSEPAAGLGSDVTDHRLTRPDGRIVAWSETGVADGRPLLRVPGTPGSRLTLRADRRPWIERRLRVITTERPGFGASTRLEGRGFDEHADDLAAILDALGIDALPVIGASGASPHILAFAARHPERVTAATIIGGAAPLEPDEVDQQIGINARDDYLYAAGDFAELWRVTEADAARLMAAPVAALQAVMADTPPEDREIIDDPVWQRGFVVGSTEALRQGPGGWYDEGIATLGDWAIDLGAVRADVTWWHSDADRNCPLSAARRLVRKLPSARLHVWHDTGHLTAFRREGEVLDELLARG